MAEPKVRFKRDDGGIFPAWEQGRFGDLIEVYDEKVTSDCTLPVLTSSKTDGIQYQSDHFGREQLHDITGYNVIPRGYCTYRNRSDGTDFTFNINNLCDRGIVSKFYPVFHTTARCNLYFLMTLMNNEPKTVRKIAMTAKGTGQKVLSFLDLQKIEINIPSLEEQQKIADFLSSVDDVITASEEEVANLETQKKAVMKKIFSQEVRFKKDDESDFPEWEEHRIGDICKTYSGGTPKAGNDGYYGGSIPFIRSGEIHSDSTELFLSEEGLKKSSAKMVAAGDVIMALYGATSGEIDISKIEGAINQAILCIKPEDGFDRKFVVEVFRNYKDDILKTYLQGGQGNLSAQIVLGLSFEFPCVEEQRLIADFLSDFDEAIAAAKKELELWKELKKGLLQQMFV